MANVLPKPIVARIQWAENHVAAFTTNAVAIGISAPIATDFQTKTENARAALQARDLAKQALTDRETELRLALDAVTTAGAAIVNTVHAKADMVGDSVYALASIPVPATPAPRPTPGTPTDFKVELGNDGSITLGWACANFGNPGTQYQVWRKIDAETNWRGMGATGERKFVDATIPAGSKTITYKIQATRTTGGGPFGVFVVNFGVDGAGGTTALVTQVSPKLAA
jgi:hypothetical protein